MTDVPRPDPPETTPPPPPPPGATTTPHHPESWAIGGPSTGPIGKPRSIWLVILLTIVTLGIWAIVWSYQNGSELKHRNGEGFGGGGYLALMLSTLVIPAVGPVVTMFVMASEVEKMYRREELEPKITTVWGLWFLLPIIGNLIWYIRIQTALNHYWTTHGSTEKPGL